MPKLVDLSVELVNKFPTHPAFPFPLIWNVLEHEEARKSFSKGLVYGKANMLLMCEHTSTHIDSFSHIDPSPQAESIDQMPLEWFYTDAICVDVSHVKPATWITVEDLKQGLKEHGLSIKQGDTFLYYLAHHKQYWGTPEWLTTFAGLSRESTEWLYDQGARNVGCESISIDCSANTHSDSDPPYPSHAVCRERRMMNMEVLGNMEAVLGKRFKFACFPLKIRGGTGSPIRAVAFLE